MDGHHRWTSETQLESVDSGPMTMKGPYTPWERRWANRPMVCTCRNGTRSFGVRHELKLLQLVIPSYAHANVTCAALLCPCLHGRPVLCACKAAGMRSQVLPYAQGAHRLSKAHLVGQDPVEPIVPERHHPLDPLQLVRAEVSLDERHQLLLHLHFAQSFFMHMPPCCWVCEQVHGTRRIKGLRCYSLAHVVPDLEQLLGKHETVHCDCDQGAIQPKGTFFEPAVVCAAAPFFLVRPPCLPALRFWPAAASVSANIWSSMACSCSLRNVVYMPVWFRSLSSWS